MIGRKEGNLRWTYTTGGSIPATPAVAGGLVIVPSRDGRIHAVDAVTGDARWSFEMEQELPYAWGFDAYLSSPRVVGDAVYVGSGDGHLYRPDATTGTARWAFPVGARVRSTPDVTDGLAVIGTVDGIVYAVDAETGRERWRFETAGAALDPADFGFDRRGIVSSAAVADGVAVIGGRDGLAAYVAERRRKEFDVRKVLGASVGHLVLLISRDFGRLILVSILIAVPLTYWGLSRWMTGFAYQAGIHPSSFVIAALATLGIAVATVSVHAYRAATTDPVRSLRTE